MKSSNTYCQENQRRDEKPQLQVGAVSHTDEYKKHQYFLVPYQLLLFLRHWWLTIYKCSSYNFSISSISIERNPTKLWEGVFLISNSSKSKDHTNYFNLLKGI